MRNNEKQWETMRDNESQWDPMRPNERQWETKSYKEIQRETMGEIDNVLLTNIIWIFIVITNDRKERNTQLYLEILSHLKTSLILHNISNG